MVELLPSLGNKLGLEHCSWTRGDTLERLESRPRSHCRVGQNGSAARAFSGV